MERSQKELEWGLLLVEAGLWDASFYLSQLDQPPVIDPLVHFFRVGSPAGLSPHPLFDSQWYQKQYPEVVSSGLPPIVYYLLHGWKKFHDPSPYFDTRYYLEQVPSLPPDLPPLVHYLKKGWVEGRNPHPRFDTVFYLERYPDIKRARINPLVHYLLWGKREGRIPHPEYRMDEDEYLEWLSQVSHLETEGSLDPKLTLLVIVPYFQGDPFWLLRLIRSFASQPANRAILAVIEGPLVRGVSRPILEKEWNTTRPWRVWPLELGQDVVPALRLLEADLWVFLSPSDVLAPGALAWLARDDFTLDRDRVWLEGPPAIHPAPWELDQRLFLIPSCLVNRLWWDFREPQNLRGCGFIWRNTPQLAWLPRVLTFRGAQRQARVFETKLRVSKESGTSGAIYVHSQGNFFFHDLAVHLARGLASLGIRVPVRDERGYPDVHASFHIVMAPHEFFLFSGKPPCDPKAGLHILVNTEQPESSWLLAALPFLRRADAIWDLHFVTAELFRSQGYRARYLPWGALEEADPLLAQEEERLFLQGNLPASLSYLCGTPSNLAWEDRPLDLLFLGALTPRRGEWFAKMAPVLARYRHCFLFSDPRRAAAMESTPLASRALSHGLCRRARILLNLHHGDYPYFEWHRVALLGIENGALVLSEPCGPAPPLQPGRDFVVAPRDKLVELICYFLSTEQGQAEASERVRQAYQFWKTEVSFRKYLCCAIREDLG